MWTRRQVLVGIGLSASTVLEVDSSSANAGSEDSKPLTSASLGRVVEHQNDGRVRVESAAGIELLPSDSIAASWKWQRGDRVVVQTDIISGRRSVAPLVRGEAGVPSLSGDVLTVGGGEGTIGNQQVRDEADRLAKRRTQSLALFVDNAELGKSSVFGIRQAN